MMCDKCKDVEHKLNACYLKYGDAALLYGKCIGCDRTPEEICQQETIETLEWMTLQFKWQYDIEKEAMQDEGSQGGYSPRLTKAIDLLIRLKEQE